MGKINLNVGDEFTFTKTIGETDVYMFAGITGDFTMHHINEEYMKTTPFKTRIAHGALTMGFTSTALGKAVQSTGQTCINVGYDKVRFLKPVMLGETITASYTVVSMDEQTGKVYGDIKCTNQNGDVVLVGANILKIIF